MPDILFWDPTFYFHGVTFLCSSCEEQGLFEELHPICWKGGSWTYYQLCHLCGLRNNVLLVSRVYLCRNKHQILSHDSGIIAQIKGKFLSPFFLCHKVGVTREMFQFVASHVRAEVTISDIQVLWQQTLFDEYGLRKLRYVQETRSKAVNFPVFSSQGWKVGEKILTACYIQSYFEREHLYSARMSRKSKLLPSVQTIPLRYLQTLGFGVMENEFNYMTVYIHCYEFNWSCDVMAALQRDKFSCC